MHSCEYQTRLNFSRQPSEHSSAKSPASIWFFERIAFEETFLFQNFFVCESYVSLMCESHVWIAYMSRICVNLIWSTSDRWRKLWPRWNPWNPSRWALPKLQAKGSNRSRRVTTSSDSCECEEGGQTWSFLNSVNWIQSIRLSIPLLRDLKRGSRNWGISNWGIKWKALEIQKL